MAREMTIVNADKAGNFDLGDLPHVEGPECYPDKDSTALDLIEALRWAFVKDYIQWLTDPNYSAEKKHWPEMDRLSLALSDMVHGRTECPCDRLTKQADSMLEALVDRLFGGDVQEEPEEQEESEDDLLELDSLRDLLFGTPKDK